MEKRRKKNRALLIAGSGGSDLPFLALELKEVTACLNRENTRKDRNPLDVQTVSTKKELFAAKLHNVIQEQIDLFRVVHYSGHWNHNDGSLVVNGEAWELASLVDFINRSLLVLDGCSSSHGLQAWVDLDGLTADLITGGAFGCIASVLPVKNDPLAARAFWGTLYRELRLNDPGTPVGHALVKARSALREFYNQNGLSGHPGWACYQLIGNPTINPLSDTMA